MQAEEFASKINV